MRSGKANKAKPSEKDLMPPPQTSSVPQSEKRNQLKFKSQQVKETQAKPADQPIALGKKTPARS